VVVDMVQLQFTWVIEWRSETPGEDAACGESQVAARKGSS
jgi:hypothetical protein